MLARRIVFSELGVNIGKANQTHIEHAVEIHVQGLPAPPICSLHSYR
jgi:hypothetical protein